jgi:hypothetical protein
MLVAVAVLAFTPGDKQALTEQMRSFDLCRQVGPT